MAVSPADRAAGIAWLHAFHRGCDALDPAAWIPAFFSEDCAVHFGTNAPLHGREQLLPAMAKQMALLERMGRTYGRIDVLPDVLYHHADIEYVVKGDPEGEVVKIRAMARMWKSVGSEVCTGMDIYGDFTALSRKIESVHGQGRRGL